MSQDSFFRPAPRLSSFEGGGHLEVGSRLMWIGLHHSDPYQALERLTEEPHSMSVAIHEITHFLSLRNSVGRVLTLLAQLASFQAEVIRDRLDAGEPLAGEEVAWFLFLRIRHELILRVWAPLLEGLAVYAQTARPCRHLDELNPAVSPILHVALTLAALDGRGASGPESIKIIANRLVEAAHRCTEAGPSLVVDGRPLAAALEFPSGPRWVPYFLGHAYIRGVADRFTRDPAAVVCPEIFIPLVLRLISSSGYRNQQGEPNPEDLGYIRQVYGWIATISAAPADRLHEAIYSPADFDVLHFIQTGEQVPINDMLSTTRNTELPDINAAGAALSAELSATEPTAWRALSAQAEYLTAFSASQAPPGWTAPEAKARIIGGIMFGVESLNFSSGGIAQLAGLCRHAAAADRHLVGVRVADAIWWIMLSDEELQRFPWLDQGIPDFAVMDDPFDASAVPEAGIPVSLDVYLSYVSMGKPEPTLWAGRPLLECLIQLSDDEHRALFKVRPAPPPHHRAVLVPVEATSASAVLLGSNVLRDMSSGAVSADLDNWAGYLRRHGQAQAADDVSSAGRQQRLTTSRIDQVILRKILLELLGDRPRQRQQRSVMTDGMRGVLPETRGLVELLTASYAYPCSIAEYAGGSLNDDLARINSISQAHIGKPVFGVERDKNTVRYLGLWG